MQGWVLVTMTLRQVGLYESTAMTFMTGKLKDYVGKTLISYLVRMLDLSTKRRINLAADSEESTHYEDQVHTALRHFVVPLNLHPRSRCVRENSRGFNGFGRNHRTKRD